MFTTALFGMIASMKARSIESVMPKNHILRIALGTACILLIPLVAMQFSSEVDWRANDFIVMGILLFGIGLLYELITTKVRSTRRRLVVAGGLLVVLLYLWAELAVGIFTHWGS